VSRAEPRPTDGRQPERQAFAPWPRIRAAGRPDGRLRGVLLGALLLLALGCEGSGSAGRGLVVEDEVLDPRCTPVAGSFPSGLDLSPDDVDRGLLAQFQPPAVVVFDLTGERPRTLALQTIPEDSDMDGVADPDRSAALGFFPLSPLLGGIEVVAPDLALLSASNYEEVLFVDPDTAEQRTLIVESPAATGDFDPDHYPFLPPGGEAHLRAAVSTRACVFPPEPFDSLGDPIRPEARCDATLPGYFTSLTAGKTIAAGHLFVATSNLKSSGQSRFNPGSVLVYEWEEVDGIVRVRPDVDVPVIFTTGFNPTGVTPFVTASGRELVLVTVTGAIGAGTGGGNLKTPAAIDVIDAAQLRVAASIPLGFAGPSFDALAIDPSGRVALLGASSQRRLYAVDLAPLDDPLLYQGDAAPVLLDGLTAGFPDARIFSADRPLELPDRAEGPSAAVCEGLTHVAINAAGTEAFASEHCDGTLTRIRLDLTGSPPVPVPGDRFQVFLQNDLVAPLTPASIGLLRAPGPLRVRPGVPVADYEGPDVVLILGQPDAQLCGVRVEAR
jgi:hypothetical protein